MISYISSYENQKHFNHVIEEMQLSVMSSFVDSKFDFFDYIKRQAGQIQNCKFLIVDLDAIKETAEEFQQALNSFRILYTTKIIIVASGRLPGDEYLNHAFCSAIYDIVTAEKEELEDELKGCIAKGKTFKDSVKYQTVEKAAKEENRPSTIIKEKLIVKNNVRKIANKETIGFLGTQSRVGVTHNTIVCAEYLTEQSFSVAVIEVKGEKESSYKKLASWFDAEETDADHFSLHDIDFFPTCELDNLHLILSKNYNFFLIDFGVYRKELESEFIRTAIPVVIGCTKPWEIENMNNIFSAIPMDFLQEFYYVLNLTQSEERDSLKENMKPIQKVFFQDYLENPFNGKFAGIFQTILKDYLTEVKISHSKADLFKRFRGVLKKYDRNKEKEQEDDSL